MKLHVENFLKIAKADLEFKGLTVIVGDNNTGKSTVGKLLFSLFDLYSSTDEQIKVARRNFVVNGGRFPNFQALDIDALIDDASLTEEGLADILRSSPEFHRVGMSQAGQEMKHPVEAKNVWVRQLAREIYARIVDSRKIPARQFIMMHALTGLGNYFYGPLIPKRHGNGGDTIIRLEIHGKAIDIKISDNLFSSKEDIVLLHKGWFVGSPALLNAVSQERVDDCTERVHIPLLKKLVENRDGDLVSAALVDERLQPVTERLNALLPGTFSQRKNYKILDFKSGEFPDGIPVESLSMGLKSFALLRLMLERGVLQDEDVLVLDEPENHLHPSWQLVYAEIIVLLQKIFRLTVLLTTHSPYFLEAVRLFSAKHGTNGALTVYKPKEKDFQRNMAGEISSQVEFVGITDNMEEMHIPFASPLRDLRNLSGEIGL